MIRLALDPGHGPKEGHFTGCQFDGFNEDLFALKACFHIANYLNKNDEFSTMILRDANEHPSFTERARRAKEFGADIVYSIHANAQLPGTEPVGAAHGALCFYMPGDEIAHKASVSTIISIGRAGEYVKKGRVRAMKNQVFFASPIDWRGGAYAVIRQYGDLPAVCFETEYASHEPSRSFLLSEDGLDRIAEAVAAGSAWAHSLMP